MKKCDTRPVISCTFTKFGGRKIPTTDLFAKKGNCGEKFRCPSFRAHKYCVTRPRVSTELSLKTNKRFPLCTQYTRIHTQNTIPNCRRTKVQGAFCHYRSVFTVSWSQHVRTSWHRNFALSREKSPPSPFSSPHHFIKGIFSLSAL